MLSSLDGDLWVKRVSSPVLIESVVGLELLHMLPMARRDGTRRS